MGSPAKGSGMIVVSLLLDDSGGTTSLKDDERPEVAELDSMRCCDELEIEPWSKGEPASGSGGITCSGGRIPADKGGSEDELDGGTTLLDDSSGGTISPEVTSSVSIENDDDELPPSGMLLADEFG